LPSHYPHVYDIIMIMDDDIRFQKLFVRSNHFLPGTSTKYATHQEHPCGSADITNTSSAMNNH